MHTLIAYWTLLSASLLLFLFAIIKGKGWRLSANFYKIWGYYYGISSFLALLLYVFLMLINYEDNFIEWKGNLFGTFLSLALYGFAYFGFLVYSSFSYGNSCLFFRLEKKSLMVTNASKTFYKSLPDSYSSLFQFFFQISRKSTSYSNK